MSSEKTPNLGMHKWVPSDYVQMDEFNDNFGKIDIVTEELAGKIGEAEETVATVAAETDSKLAVVTSQLADTAIHVEGLDMTGTIDVTQNFLDAIAKVDLNGGGTVIAPYSGKGYKITKQLVLTHRTTLDLRGSLLLVDGELKADPNKSVILVNGVNNIVRNVLFRTAVTSSSTQYLIEFGASSKNNLEENCENRNIQGIEYLVKPENVNAKSSTNVSLSLQGISKGGLVKKSRILELDITVPASTFKPITINKFPSRCRIKKISITDKTNSPDFFAALYSDNAGTTKVYERARSSTNVDVSVDIDWIQKELNDTLLLKIYNHNTSTSIMNLKIYFEDEIYLKEKILWKYFSKNDFLRPHTESTVDLTSLTSVEYRYKLSGNGTVGKIGITPSNSEGTGVNSYLPKVDIPELGTQDKTYSQLKFYFDYSAQRAVIEKPKKFIFEFKNFSENIDCNLICGWVSQNKDGDPAYLHTSMIHPNANPKIVSLKSADFSTYRIEVNIDPKGYQAGSILPSGISFDFFYVVFETNDPSGSKAFEFGKSYGFNAWFE